MYRSEVTVKPFNSFSLCRWLASSPDSLRKFLLTCMNSACSLFLMLKYHFALLSCALSSTLITALDEVSVYMDKCDSYQVTDRSGLSPLGLLVAPTG